MIADAPHSGVEKLAWGYCRLHFLMVAGCAVVLNDAPKRLVFEIEECTGVVRLGHTGSKSP